MTAREAVKAVEAMQATPPWHAQDMRDAQARAGRLASSLVDENDLLRAQLKAAQNELNQSRAYSPSAESEWAEVELREERDAARTACERLRAERDQEATNHKKTAALVAAALEGSKRRQLELDRLRSAIDNAATGAALHALNVIQGTLPTPDQLSDTFSELSSHLRDVLAGGAA